MELPAVERLRWNRGDGLEVEETEDALSPASKDPDLGLEESIPGTRAARGPRKKNWRGIRRPGATWAQLIVPSCEAEEMNEGKKVRLEEE